MWKKSLIYQLNKLSYFYLLNVASWFIADAVKAPIMVEDKKLVEKKHACECTLLDYPVYQGFRLNINLYLVKLASW